MFIRFIVYSFAFYFIMKIAKYVVRYFTSDSSSEKPHVTQSRKQNSPIYKRDIVEAEFVEIVEEEKVEKEEE